MPGKNVASLTILEGKWFPEKHVSVQELYIPMLKIGVNDDTFKHYYEPFTTELSFKNAIARAMAKNMAEIINISCHGQKDQLVGYQDDKITLEYTIESINQVKGTQTKGIVFDSCLFGHETNCSAILEQCSRISWIAGYTKSPDWMDSALLNLFFLRNYHWIDMRKMKNKTLTGNNKAEYAAKQVKQKINGLAQSCGFQVYIRDGRKGIIKLL